MEPEHIDDVVKRMEKDDTLTVYDLLDEQGPDDMGVWGLELMTPRDYATMRGLLPQQVYYYIRKGVIHKIACLCGKTVIDGNQADKALSERGKSS